MNRLLLSVVLTIGCLTLQAQVRGYAVVPLSYGHENEVYTRAGTDSLDTSQMECVYSHIVADSVTDGVREYPEILEVGMKVSKYGDYNTYCVDSVIQAFVEKEGKTPTVKDYFELSKPYVKQTSCYVFKSKTNGQLEIVDKVSVDRLCYKDSLPDMEWTVSDDTMTVCGYLCRKAVTCFRGRCWTAWYCDLPVSDGPWKFCGLPGLILHIEDRSRHHVFSAIAIRSSKRAITKSRSKVQKTTREGFNKAMMAYHADPESVLPIITISSDGHAVNQTQKCHNEIEMK